MGQRTEAIQGLVQDQCLFCPGPGVPGGDQERILLNKKGPCHELFVEFKQGKQPISMPPTLVNGGNALAVATQAAMMEGVQARGKNAEST